MRNVSSGFLSEANKTNAPWRRRFLIGTSDYTAMVTKWPTIQTRWNDINPKTLSIEVANNSGHFNGFMIDPTLLASSSVQLQFGFQYAVGSTEYLHTFGGTIDSIRYRDGAATMSIINKFKKLADRLIGSNTTPTNYTGSNYLVHDLAWYACTSHGGLSAIQSTSNPDIDYASFTSWTAIWSTDNVRMRAQFKGQRANEVLKKIGELTYSAIFIEDNKIKFARFSVADSPVASYNSGRIIGLENTLDDRMLLNTVNISAAYSTGNDYFGILLTHTDSSSISRYGLREETLQDTVVWLVDSVSALGQAQRAIIMRKEIKGQFRFRTPLMSLHCSVGDVVQLVDPHLVINDLYRVLEEGTDMENGTRELMVDQTQYISAFTLDVSALDSSDVLI